MRLGVVCRGLARGVCRTNQIHINEQLIANYYRRALEDIIFMSIERQTCFNLAQETGYLGLFRLPLGID